MKKYMAILFITMAATACSGVKVLETETADNTELARYKTFDFYDVKASGDTVSSLYNERINMLMDAISTQLAQRGYVRSSANPDLRVNIGIRVDEKVQTRTTDWRTDGAPRYIGQRNYSWKSEEIEVGRYREGTVTVHLVDAFKNKMVWKGAIQGIISSKSGNAQKNIQDGVKKLFEKFPVPVK